MIILDTTIISELMKAKPDEQIIAWLDNQETSDLFVTTVTLAEIYYNLKALPKERRRKNLEHAFSHVVKEAFQHRVLDFDLESADEYGELMAYRKSLGRPLSVRDGQIAAITRLHDAVMVTRNASDFSDCGLSIINPFF